MKLRCPTYGLKGNFWNFDLFPYIDGCLGEVGLNSYKRKGWWNDLTKTLLISDLKGLKDEYVEKFGKENAGMDIQFFEVI